NDLSPDIGAEIDAPLDCVGYLELATGGGDDAFDRFKKTRIEHVDAEDDQVRGRFERLLDESHGAAIVVEDGDPEVDRVRDGSEKDLGVTAGVAKRVHEGHNAAAEEIITEKDDKRALGDEVAADFY